MLIWGLVFPTQLLVQLSGNEAGLSTAGEVLTAQVETRPLESVSDIVYPLLGPEVFVHGLQMPQAQQQE